MGKIFFFHPFPPIEHAADRISSGLPHPLHFYSFILAGRSIMLPVAAQRTEHGSGHRSKNTCNKQDLLHTHLLLPRKKNRLPDPTAKNRFQNAPCHRSLTFSPEETHSLPMGENKLPESRRTEMEPWAGLPSPAILLKQPDRNTASKTVR